MLKEIYLAGGCFWGTEQYLKNVKGVVKTQVGYANGSTHNPTYREVCHQNTGHAETVKVEYDDQIITLPYLLKLYYDVIDPTSVNRQGGDSGAQYRTGVYYTQPQDEAVILASIAELQRRHDKPVAIEVLPLENYGKAEEFHQRYLEKNPGGYCHIGSEKFEQARRAADPAASGGARSREELKKTLTPMQFEVTQNSATEPPFQNAYYNHFEKGIYVDVTTGQPLFSSGDKFDSGCGWPTFSKPLDKVRIREHADLSHSLLRTEVRATTGDAHLGHVFTDGPPELGGRRYCINSAALRFVPREEMEKQGYGEYLPLTEEPS